MKSFGVITGTFVTMLLLAGCGDDKQPQEAMDMKVALGERLFHDKNLSKNRTMACATCHDPSRAFTDPRVDNLTLGASRGDDNVSLGDRNAPTAMYAAFAPSFFFDEEFAEEGEDGGVYRGGQFLDGRARDLKEQAKGPLLNPVEMGMPSAASVVDRVKENSGYVSTLKRIYGEDIFVDIDRAYDAIADAIATYERKDPDFTPFDSKFDRVMAGKEKFSALEAKGYALFNGKAQCNACHTSTGKHALFTDFTYDNLGVPENKALRVQNGVGVGHQDIGLLGNPAVDDEGLKGAFKVATLRNVAVTGPYMHNGVFKDLKTVVHFYNTRDVPGAINPETNATWEMAEVEETKNMAELGDLGLTDEEEDAIVAFLKTLTDRKYEHLLP